MGLSPTEEAGNDEFACLHTVALTLSPSLYLQIVLKSTD